MTTKQSLPRQALRFVRFLIAIPILKAAFAGEINGWIALFSYIGVWIVFLLVDALIVYSSPLDKGLPYPLNQLPRADHRRR
jgi:O-antigen ligase